MRDKNNMDVCSNEMIETLAPHQPIDHGHDLEPGFDLPHSQKLNFLG